jgi:uncharacterized lipoprotein YmbA
MKKPATLLLITLITLTLSACAASPPTNLYILTPMARSNGDISHKTARPISVGVGPISLPEYIDRPQIVTRTGHNTLRLAEFDNWAERLNNNIAEVMAENISILLTTDKVVIYPWQRPHPIDYQIILDISQFERDPKGRARLTAHWHLVNGEGQSLSTGKRSLLTASPKGGDYNSLVKALSQTLADLSREIAGAIKTLPPGRK